MVDLLTTIASRKLRRIKQYVAAQKICFGRTKKKIERKNRKNEKSLLFFAVTAAAVFLSSEINDVGR